MRSPGGRTPRPGGPDTGVSNSCGCRTGDGRRKQGPVDSLAPMCGSGALSSDLARVGPTTPKQLGAVTVRDSMEASRQARIEPRGSFADASVDPTDARNTSPPETRQWGNRECGTPRLVAVSEKVRL